MKKQYNPRKNPRFKEQFGDEESLFNDEKEDTDFNEFNDSKDNDKDNDDIFSEDEDMFQEDFGMDEGIGGTPPMEKHGDLLKELTNFNRFIREKINGWLGLRWSEEKETWINDPDIDPIMNKKCAAWCIDFLKTYARDNNIITNIHKDDYNFIMQDVVHVLWKNLGARAEEFNIKNNGDLLKVCVDMEHAVSLVLMGAGDGKYNEFLGGTMSRTESISGQNFQGNGQMVGQQMPKKQGFVSKMKSLLEV